MLRISEENGELRVFSRSAVLPAFLAGGAVVTAIVTIGKWRSGDLSDNEMLIAAGMILFLTALVWLTAEMAEFIFSRRTGRFVWLHRRIGRKSRLEIPLNEILKARREIFKDSEGDTYRIVVETSRKLVPLTKEFQGDSGQMAVIAEQINDYLAASGKP